MCVLSGNRLDHNGKDRRTNAKLSKRNAVGSCGPRDIAVDPSTELLGKGAKCWMHQGVDAELEGLFGSVCPDVTEVG